MGQGWDEAEAWPVARSYTGAELNRISLPLGGIGTGTVGFGGRGQFRDWELENHPSKGLTSALTFFACRVAGKDGGAAGPDLRGRPVRRGGRGLAGVAGAAGRAAPVRAV